jgi:hypothetical protein
LSIFVIALVVLLVIVAARWPSLARKQPDGDTFPAAFLVKSGTQSGLGRGWEHGNVTVTPTALTFGAVGSFGIKSRREPMTIEISAVTDKIGKVGWGQAWSLNPLFTTLEFATPTAVLLLAASGPAVERFRAVTATA